MHLILWHTEETCNYFLYVSSYCAFYLVFNYCFIILLLLCYFTFVPCTALWSTEVVLNVLKIDIELLAKPVIRVQLKREWFVKGFQSHDAS